MVTVDVDFNDLAHRGKVVVHMDRADGPVSVGDHVRAVDFDQLTYNAVVAEADPTTRIIYLSLLDEVI